jgi:two-component sensor histidine kinase
MSGRPVEQLVLPIRDAQRSVVAALSVERSLLNGPWSAARRPLAEAARSLATSLLKAALAPGDLLILLRMARGLTVLSADGEVLFTDPTARASWAKALGRAGLPGRLPPGAPPGSTLLGRHEEPWGSEWEFDVHGSVFRRRDLRLGADPAGGTLVLLQDVTALHAGQAVVSTRAAAFQEIHHRVKNNLQTISSLLRMQARRETSEPARDSLRTAIARVQSVAFVHEVLSLDGAEEIDLKALATTLADSAVHDAHGGRGRIVAAVLGPRLFVPAARASQVALVLNEALQNAVKHAFPDDRPGSVTVRFEPRAEEVVVTVQDDGIGLPTDLALRKTGALGLQIARTIAESDLGGKLTLAGNGGTTFALRLPASLAHQETENP